MPALNGVDFDVAEPQLFPDVGLWHPLAPTMYEDLKEYLNWCAALSLQPMSWDAWITHRLHGMSKHATGQSCLGLCVWHEEVVPVGKPLAGCRASGV